METLKEHDYLKDFLQKRSILGSRVFLLKSAPAVSRSEAVENSMRKVSVLLMNMVYRQTAMLLRPTSPLPCLTLIFGGFQLIVIWGRAKQKG